MKKNKLGAMVTGVVLMTSIGVPMMTVANTANAGNLQGRPTGTVDSDAAQGGYRFVVKYRAGASELRDTARANQGISAAATRAGLNRAVPATSRSVALPAVGAALLRRMGSPGWAVVKTSRPLNAVESVQFIREMQANPAVESVEVDYLYQHTGIGPTAWVPNDPDSANKQWNFYNKTSGVNASEAWDISQGEGVVVAVLDTGIVQGNPDLQNNVIPGYDMITESSVSRRATDARIPGGWDVGDWTEENYCGRFSGQDPDPAEESSWHGSHVAGTIAQETNNGLNVAGLAFKAKVMPVRVLGSCGGYSSDIADGIIWAAGGEVPGLPVNPTPADVINMSLGGRATACPRSYQAAINQAVSLGAIIVAAAGNSNVDAGQTTMSICDNLIVVGASGFNGGRAYYSNYGLRVDLSAPGGGGEAGVNGQIHQVTNAGKQQPTGDWELRAMAGTSMAAPHVTAAVAMIQSVVETPLTWMQMRDLLASTTKPFAVVPPPRKPMGTGILDIKAALDKALRPPCDPAVEECRQGATPLVKNVPVNGLVSKAGKELLYSFQAEAGKVLSLMSYGGTGDASMYVSFDKEPTTSAFEAGSARSGTTTETIRITAPKAGTYYIKLVGATSYSGVTLVARQ